MPALRYLLLGLVAAGLCAWGTVARAQSLPGLGANPQRDRVDANSSPWNALVRVQVPGASRCTGFRIAPDRVVTAGHCLYSARLGHFAPPGAVHVLLGYQAGSLAAHTVAATYRTADGFDPRRVDATRGADIAVIQLAAPLPGPVLALGALAPGLGVALGGYNQDRAEVIAADLDCAAVGRARDAAGREMIAHSCAGTRGSSGAPLLQRGRDGTWRAVGVQVGAHAAAIGGFAVPADAVAALAAAP